MAIVQTELHIIANGTYGTSMSGGDRILIEMTRRWVRLCCRIYVYVNEEGRLLYLSYGLQDVEYRTWRSAAFKSFGFLVAYLGRIAVSVFKSLALRIGEGGLVYSASDFLPDFLPAMILKLKYGKMARWIAGFYMFAPNPFSAHCPYKGLNRLRGAVYYFTQFPVYMLIRYLADAVCVTSQPDVRRFVTRDRPENNIIVVRGGVDIGFCERIPASGSKKFDAVFMGRLHPQKGILELLDIWKLVSRARPEARLAVIGDGPLYKAAKDKAERLGVSANTQFFGFKDGEEKVCILKSARIVVHPATYDSGGMAACEAMACGLPGVSFDLESLKTYYPKGMLKVECFNKEKFSEAIEELLSDEGLYNRLSGEASNWAREWDWDARAKEILCRMRGNDIKRAG
jgi:glycosyltransferase involved in cell wall biosynthesis